jgi:hypothetical protein
MSVKGEIKEGAGFVKEESSTSTASRRKAKQKHRKVAICATKGGAKTARSQRRPNPVPAIRKSKNDELRHSTRPRSAGFCSAAENRTASISPSWASA